MYLLGSSHSNFRIVLLMDENRIAWWPGLGVLPHFGVRDLPVLSGLIAKEENTCN